MGTHIPILGRLNYNVRVIARPILIEFGKKHRDANNSIEAWYWEARKAEWKNVNEVKAQYRTASILKKRRVVFNICGNKYRLVVAINYESKIVYIRFIGTHKDYDLINPENI